MRHVHGTTLAFPALGRCRTWPAVASTRLMPLFSLWYNHVLFEKPQVVPCGRDWYSHHHFKFVPKEENHARAELERRKQEQRLRERNRRQREIAEERRLRELKKKVRCAVFVCYGLTLLDEDLTGRERLVRE